MTRLYAIASGLLALVFLVGIYLISKPVQTAPATPLPSVPYLILKNQRVELLLAATPAERTQGLSNHATLSANQGMLFIFESESNGPFWMKDMLFALDIIWLQAEKVVAISRNIPPPALTNGIPEIVDPRTSYTHVLEIAGGWADAQQLQVGDIAQYHL